MSKWERVVKVNAGKVEIDGPAIMAFRERCITRPFDEKSEEDPFYIPPWLDRRKPK